MRVVVDLSGNQGMVTFAECPKCRAVVIADQLDRHKKWHRKLNKKDDSAGYDLPEWYPGAEF